MFKSELKPTNDKLNIKSYNHIRAKEMLALARRYMAYTKWKEKYDIVYEKESSIKND